MLGVSVGDRMGDGDCGFGRMDLCTFLFGL